MNERMAVTEDQITRKKVSERWHGDGAETE